MRPMKFLVGSTVIIQGVTAHYAFYTLLINENVTGPWQYFRKPSWIISLKAKDAKQNSPAQIKPAPNVLIDPINLKTKPSINLACRENAFAAANQTDVAPVLAGIDELGFLSGGYTVPRSHFTNITIFHPGPVGVYLSKAPTGNVKEYDGSGDWFRIYSLGYNESIPVNETQQWYPENNWNIRFKIPKTTPPGQYLLRIEQIYFWPNITKLQLFINCAQIDVQGPGGGTPKPLFKLTDYLHNENPYLTTSSSMHLERSRDIGWKDPAPPVWSADDTDDDVDSHQVNNRY